jgi:uncharacterized repeat protein (TIGR02543 family)
MSFSTTLHLDAYGRPSHITLNYVRRPGSVTASENSEVITTEVVNFVGDNIRTITASDLTFVGNGSLTTFTVTFNTQGGSAVASQTVTESGKATQPANPTRTDYTFAGWYREAACTNAWNFANDAVTADITLYAKWISAGVTTYTVTFDTQGGNAVTSQTVEQGGKVAQPANPSRTDYNFAGWYKEAVCTNAWNFATDLVTANITLYAKWTQGTGTVTGFETPDAPLAGVYPNPTDGLLTLSFATPGAYRITIADMSGKALLRQSVADPTYLIDISGYPAGVYLLTIDDGNRQSTIRVIKN